MIQEFLITLFSGCVLQSITDYKGGKERLECIFQWDENSDYCPVLEITNYGERAVVIKTITVLYGWQKLGKIDVQREKNYKNCSIIEGGTKTVVRISWKMFCQAKRAKNGSIYAIIETPRRKRVVSIKGILIEELQALIIAAASEL